MMQNVESFSVTESISLFYGHSITICPYVLLQGEKVQLNCMKEVESAIIFLDDIDLHSSKIYIYISIQKWN